MILKFRFPDVVAFADISPGSVFREYMQTSYIRVCWNQPMQQWLHETGLMDEILIQKDWTALVLDDFYHKGNPTFASLVADWRASIAENGFISNEPFHIEFTTEQALIMFKLRWM